MDQIDMSVKMQNYMMKRMGETMEVPPSGPHTAPAAGGSSLQQAVVIEGIVDDTVLEKAERAWIAKKYPSSIVGARSIQGIDGRHYSTVEITTAGGESRSVRFDITDYFSHQ